MAIFTNCNIWRFIEYFDKFSHIILNIYSPNILEFLTQFSCIFFFANLWKILAIFTNCIIWRFIDYFEKISLLILNIYLPNIFGTFDIIFVHFLFRLFMEYFLNFYILHYFAIYRIF